MKDQVLRDLKRPLLLDRMGEPINSKSMNLSSQITYSSTRKSANTTSPPRIFTTRPFPLFPARITMISPRQDWSPCRLVLTGRCLWFLQKTRNSCRTFPSQTATMPSWMYGWSWSPLKIPSTDGKRVVSVSYVGMNVDVGRLNICEYNRPRSCSCLL
jgi:hypothetical protein